MQNFILTVLILGLGFFLYLIKIGEIDSNIFSIKNLRGAVRFEIVKVDSISLQKSEILKLNVRDNLFDIYSLTGMELKHIPRSEYYMNIYNIPLEAKDAVTGTWLGSRYNFYVTEETVNDSQEDLLYRIYKAEYPTDTTEPVEYIQFKTVRGLDLRNAVDVRY